MANDRHVVRNYRAEIARKMYYNKHGCYGLFMKKCPENLLLYVHVGKWQEKTDQDRIRPSKLGKWAEESNSTISF